MHLLHKKIFSHNLKMLSRVRHGHKLLSPFLSAKTSQRSAVFIGSQQLSMADQNMDDSLALKMSRPRSFSTVQHPITRTQQQLSLSSHPASYSRNQSRSYTIPVVLESGATGERSFDIYSRLLRERIIFLGTGVDDAVADALVAQMLFLEAADPAKDIQIYVNGELFHRDEAKVSVFDSGFVLGDGVWEGLRVHHGQVAFLDAHLPESFEALCVRPSELLVDCGRRAPGTIWKVRKAIYGFRVSPKA